MISQTLFPLIFTFIKEKLSTEIQHRKRFSKANYFKGRINRHYYYNSIKESQNPDFFNRRIKKFPQIGSSDQLVIT